MPRIVLATIGSWGDLHPFIAIGQALAARGASVVLAVPEDHVAKARAAGLEAVAILPGFAAIASRLGLSEAATVAKVFTDPRFVLDQILMPSLATSTRALDEVAEGADLIAGSIFALATPIVAEKRRLPYAAVVLQPMTLFSACQPPRAPGFAMFRHAPVGWLGRRWNRALYALGGTVLRRRVGAAIDRVRAEHALAPSRDVPLLTADRHAVATLCCYSPLLGARQPDAPPNTSVTGFTFFDSASGRGEQLDPELEAFLAAGTPPLVFTLGSLAVVAPGGFYDEARHAARQLGRQAVLLTGQSETAGRDGDCLAMSYAPHSLLFPRAAAIVHHGGIGTIGQALRAGRPQLVVPHFGDQFDNGDRLQRLGVAKVTPAARFDRNRAAAAIRDLLADASVANAAMRAADQVGRERGAEAAAARLLAIVARRA